MPVPHVDIVVLNWNNYDDTKRCLDSITDITYPDYDVILVDNGSTDGSGQQLSEEYDQHTFIFNENNLGFSAGNNRGIQKALDTGSDYVLLLNNDTVVRPDFLEPLVEAAESSNNAAAVTGVISFLKSDALWYAGGEISPYRARAYVNTVPKEESKPYKTGFCYGALVLLNPAFVRKNDILNESYFFGMDDIDLCYQAKKDGWKILVAPESEIEHEVSSTAGHKNPFRIHHETRNRLNFANEHLDHYQQLVFYIYFVLTRIVLFAKWAVTGRSDLIWSTLMGLRSYIESKK